MSNNNHEITVKLEKCIRNENLERYEKLLSKKTFISIKTITSNIEKIIDYKRYDFHTVIYKYLSEECKDVMITEFLIHSVIRCIKNNNDKFLEYIFEKYKYKLITWKSIHGYLVIDRLKKYNILQKVVSYLSYNCFNYIVENFYLNTFIENNVDLYSNFGTLSSKIFYDDTVGRCSFNIIKTLARTPKINYIEKEIYMYFLIHSFTANIKTNLIDKKIEEKCINYLDRLIFEFYSNNFDCISYFERWTIDRFRNKQHGEVVLQSLEKMKVLTLDMAAYNQLILV